MHIQIIKYPFVNKVLPWEVKYKQSKQIAILVLSDNQM